MGNSISPFCMMKCGFKIQLERLLRKKAEPLEFLTLGQHSDHAIPHHINNKTDCKKAVHKTCTHLILLKEYKQYGSLCCKKALILIILILCSRIWGFSEFVFFFFTTRWKRVIFSWYSSSETMEATLV